MLMSADNFDWISVAAPPSPYTIVLLSFDDGLVRRGVWNGKMWWGYDERVRRACELHPLGWRMWSETSPTISTRRAPRADYSHAQQAS
jgi:hypothetical protein